MKELSFDEICFISGGYQTYLGYHEPIKARNWVGAAASGAMLGTAVYVVTAFTANPLTPLYALGTASAVSVGFKIAFDFCGYMDI